MCDGFGEADGLTGGIKRFPHKWPQRSAARRAARVVVDGDTLSVSSIDFRQKYRQEKQCFRLSNDDRCRLGLSENGTDFTGMFAVVSRVTMVTRRSISVRRLARCRVGQCVCCRSVVRVVRTTSVNVFRRQLGLSFTSVRMPCGRRFATNRLGTVAVPQQRVDPEVTEERHGHVQGDGQRCDKTKHGVPDRDRRLERRKHDQRYNRSSTFSAINLQKTHIRMAT